MERLDRTESPLLLLARQGSSARISRSSVTQKEFKVILIGSSGVGKSSLCRREALDEFSQEVAATSTTIQTEKFTTTLQVRQEPIELELFDTVGQERFMTLSTVFYRKANAVLICFDGSETRTSFDQVGRWFLDAERHAPNDALILLVRTKADLAMNLVTLDECKQKASALGVHFFETSAKTGHNVKAMFHLIASQLSEDSRTHAPPLLTGKMIRGGGVSLERKPSVSSFGSVPTAPTAQASSCWSTAFSFAAAGTSEDDEDEDVGDEDSYEAEGLAEVILKHASLRAVSVAGGLKRRHTNEYNAAVTTTTKLITPLRTCTLGCGAITSVPTHEQDECWLREVTCSLRCGQRFPMLDCAAHEREACECRVITCACGDKVQFKNLPLHIQPENGDEPPQTKQEMIHLLTSLFPKDELLKNVNLREVKSARLEDLDKALLTSEAKFKVDCAIVKHATGYSTLWTEEEDVISSGKKPERLTLSSVVSLQRRNMLMRPPLVGPSRRAKKREPHDDAFASLWQDLLDCKISPNYVSDGLLLQEQLEHAPTTSRDVQVPLTLGSRVVTVRTIDFADLQELNSTNKLGVGSFGSVYLAKYRGAQVAVKHLHFQNLSERELLREAAVMTSCCHHPHILRFLGVCLIRPNICFVSEALLCSLEDWLRYDRRNMQEPLGEILRYAEEAASGLFHLHLESVVHRDIAARNLLLDTGTPRRVKVCDFGLARVVARQQREFGTDFASVAAAATNLTGGSFDMTGPLKWMAPECLKSTDGLNCFSFASDVYSFAITLWELLSRDAPYPLLTSSEAATQVLNSGLRPPKAKLRNTLALQQQLLQGDTTSTHLVFLLERAWDDNPVNRPTMRQLCSELALLQDLLQK
ncbi:hypothetical protein BASA81_007092 [Batrachochytrium salamandrivorans]|nr:hypothetical protein BASA81_007092 [Batrachochytrium salamandrivorans]